MRLSQQGLITRYKGPDGRKYLQVNSWDKPRKSTDRQNRVSRDTTPKTAHSLRPQ